MPVFVKVLKNDRMDVEITKLTLETLHILCSRKGSEDGENLGAMLTEIFIKVAPQCLSRIPAMLLCYWISWRK
jgi:hypothetical protein